MQYAMTDGYDDPIRVCICRYKTRNVSQQPDSLWIYYNNGLFVRFEVSTAVTMMIIISQKMIIINGLFAYNLI
jgi:hypothetical protein